jgi:hypothetical protein
MSVSLLKDTLTSMASRPHLGVKEIQSQLQEARKITSNRAKTLGKTPAHKQSGALPKFK